MCQTKPDRNRERGKPGVFDSTRQSPSGTVNDTYEYA